ncbi:uncharacterized protein BDZ99DRAFT_500915 [Mytilinidion resinicola]|uniref:RelA/SpoT domain-containing protein n=1 Tax=Mytilinidion resinicola TaxID=574789 RepID=A0A6A6YFQ1_9PEZI|nr:uncharacterized protein BDZ99DRAFT_500915 [Mytilinidion resinicola]KAF2806875.1 hypothetical protein BDZ99DRAFT_500915 [Mytilinidion resinicola]
MSGTQQEALSVIDSFVNNWPKEIETYEKLAKQAEAICTQKLEIAQIRHGIRSRPKAQKSLKDSIIRRQERRKAPYEDTDKIKHDLIDLAGVRIAITFPNDVDQVREMIETTFDPFLNPWDWKPPLENPLNDKLSDLESSIINRTGIKREAKRVVGEGGWPLGLKSIHFRCKLKTDDAQYRDYPGLAVEIQVATAFMYAWEDVYHDIVYKPYLGKITPEEERFIEILNGLAHTGELALKQLRQSLSLRAELEQMPFPTYSNFVNWLQESLPWTEKSNPKKELCNFDTLYYLLPLLELNTPGKLKLVIDSNQSEIMSSGDALYALLPPPKVRGDANSLVSLTERQQNLLLALMHKNTRYLAQISGTFDPINEVAVNQNSVEGAFGLYVSDDGTSTELFESWQETLERFVEPSYLSKYIRHYKMAFELACQGVMYHGSYGTWERDHLFEYNPELGAMVDILSCGCKKIFGLVEPESQNHAWHKFDWDRVWQEDEKAPLFDYGSLIKDGTVILLLGLLGNTLKDWSTKGRPDLPRR